MHKVIVGVFCAVTLIAPAGILVLNPTSTSNSISPLAQVAASVQSMPEVRNAFKDFETYATMMIMRAQAEAQGATPSTAEETRLIAYKTYNAYARFIHYLYEFMLGAVARDTGDTAQLEAAVKDKYIAGHSQRILTGRRLAILNGTAPAWENHISAYPEKVPPEFAEQFRRVRNKASGHVTHERSTISLSDFYDKYHRYVFMLYHKCREHWSILRDKEFPDLNEITKFSVLIKKGSD